MLTHEGDGTALNCYGNNPIFVYIKPKKTGYELEEPGTKFTGHIKLQFINITLVY